MLVLRRKIGEEIRMGDGVIIKVLSVNGRAIRLGIDAPPSISIWRPECAETGEELKNHGPKTSIIPVPVLPLGS